MKGDKNKLSQQVITQIKRVYHMEVFDVGVNGDLRVGDRGHSCPQTLS